MGRRRSAERRADPTPATHRHPGMARLRRSAGGAARFGRSPAGRLVVGVMALEAVAAVATYVDFALLPPIEAAFHAGHRLGLLVTGASAGVFLTLPQTGRAIRRWGLPLTLAVAVSGYLAGALISVTAATALAFAAGQVVVGAAGGVLTVFGWSAVIGSFEEGARARIFAASSAVWIAPALFAPPLAVGLAGVIGWRPTLLLPFPLVVVGSILTAGAARRGMGAQVASGRDFPVGWVLALPAGVAGVVAGTSGGPWPLAVAGGALALAAARRLLPAGTARARRGTPAALLVLLILSAGYFGADSLLTVLLTTAGGSGLYLAGLTLTGGGVSWGVASITTTRLTAGAPARRRAAVTLGTAFAALCVAGLAAGAPLPALALGAWIAGSAGMGAAYPALYLVATSGSGVAETATDLAAAALVTEFFGTLLGQAFGSGLASAATRAGMAPASGLRLADAALAGFVAVAAVLTARLAPPAAAPAGRVPATSGEPSPPAA
jgi:MFS family permease